MQKICTGCKIEKLYECFGKDKKAFDGLNQKCKVCCNARAKVSVRSEKAIENSKAYRSEWQKRKRPILNAKLRERYANNLEKCREYSRMKQREWSQTEKGKLAIKINSNKWEKENPEKRRAHVKVYKAVKSGKLQRRSHCEICNKECKAQAHHEDYNKPLDVIWMCQRCHYHHDHKHRFHAERLTEKTPKGDVIVRSSDESRREEFEAVLPPLFNGQ